MSYEPVGFDNAEVLKVPLGGNRMLFLCCGVALVNFGATGTDWRRDDVTFLVPSEVEGSSSPPPLNIGNFVDSTVIVTPATIESYDGSDEVGWGVDTADSDFDPDSGNNVRVTARTVVKGDGAVNILRIAYQVNILGTAT